MSATFGSAMMGCSSTGRPPVDDSVGARADIVTNYVASTGDEAYRVDAPDGARALGVATYDVAIVNRAIRVASLAADGKSLGSIELTPSFDGVRVITTEGGASHSYVFRASGSFQDRDFTLSMNYDGADFSVGYDERGNVVSRGDLALAPGAGSALVQQMWRDIMPTDIADGVVTAQAVSRCFACFLCGAAVTAFAAALAAILWVGWPVIAAFLSALLGPGGTAAASAVLANAGVSAAAITAVIGALSAIGFGILKYCYKCATGEDLFTDTQCKAEPEPLPTTPSAFAIEKDTTTEPGPIDPGPTPDPTDPDQCTCEIDTETTPEMGGAWAGAGN